VRSLDPEEQALWERVTATIRPLSREPVKPSAIASAPEPLKAAAPKLPKSPKGRIWQRPLAAEPPPRQPAIGNSLDGSWDRRLKAGSLAPDRVIDLHGHNLDRAWSAIDRGLDQAIAGDERVVLLITGHARQGEPPVERGRIRAAVGDWLAASRHASRIAAVRGAHPRHGGGGSLYLILRRN
jgi:DNA-nicking Smr family endonuclease